MSCAFYFKKIRYLWFACALSFLFVSPSMGFDSGNQGEVVIGGTSSPQFRLVIGDEGTEGSMYIPSIPVVTPEVPLKGKTDMSEADRCKMADIHCRKYEENMYKRCKRLQSPMWTDMEDCDATKSEHYNYCMEMSQCD